MKNLTKENFWNSMMEKYPKAMDGFCKWIDEYKIKRSWKTIFHGHLFQTPKYHDLPLEWQMGIFMLFLFERHQPLLPGEQPEDIFDNACESIEHELKRIEEKINKPDEHSA